MDDAATALVRFANGAMGTIDVTRMAPGRKNDNRFEINGSQGSVAFDLERMNELEVYFTADAPTLRGFRRVIVTEPAHPYIKAWWPPGHIYRLRAHVHAHGVRFARGDGGRSAADAELRRRRAGQRVLQAIETSARTRRWTTVE